MLHLYINNTFKKLKNTFIDTLYMTYQLYDIMAKCLEKKIILPEEKRIILPEEKRIILPEEINTGNGSILTDLIHAVEEHESKECYKVWAYSRTRKLHAFDDKRSPHKRFVWDVVCPKHNDYKYIKELFTTPHLVNYHAEKIQMVDGKIKTPDRSKQLPSFLKVRGTWNKHIKSVIPTKYISSVSIPHFSNQCYQLNFDDEAFAEARYKICPDDINFKIMQEFMSKM